MASLCVDAWRTVLAYVPVGGDWPGRGLVTCSRATHQAAIWALMETDAGRELAWRLILSGRLATHLPPVGFFRGCTAERIAAAVARGYVQAAAYHPAPIELALWSKLDLGEEASNTTIRAALRSSAGLAGLSVRALEAAALVLDHSGAMAELLQRRGRGEWSPDVSFQARAVVRPHLCRFLATRVPTDLFLWDRSSIFLTMLAPEQAVRLAQSERQPLTVFAAAFHSDPSCLQLFERAFPDTVTRHASDVVQCAVYAGEHWLDVARRLAAHLHSEDIPVIMDMVLRLRGDLEFLVATRELPAWTAEAFWRRPCCVDEPRDCPVSLSWAVRGTTGTLPRRCLRLLAAIPDPVPIPDDVTARLRTAAPARANDMLSAARMGHAKRLEQLRTWSPTVTVSPHALLQAAIESGHHLTVECALKLLGKEAPRLRQLDIPPSTPPRVHMLLWNRLA
jgi:hypothetical protein